MGSPIRSSDAKRGLAAGVALLALTCSLTAGATPPAGFTVCLVVGSGAGSSLDPAAEAGLVEAERTGVDGSVERATGAVGAEAALEACLGTGADLTIAVGAGTANAVDTVATANRSRRFAVLDMSQALLAHRPANVTGVLFRTEESAYLAGYAAALWARERSRHGPVVVGSVGSLDVPPVERYIAGFEFGARRAVRGATVVHGFSQTEVDPRACRRVAAGELTDGAKVVLAAAGACGAGVAEAAAGGRALTVATNVPAPVRAASTVLTSVSEHAGVAVLRVVDAARHGTLTGGGDIWLGVGDGGVGYGPWSPRVPVSIRRAVARQLRLLQAGRGPSIPSVLG